MRWLTIDWDGFGRTRGGFFNWRGPCAAPNVSPNIGDDRRSLTASAGVWVPFPKVEWKAWAEWRPPVPLFKMSDLLPKITAPRGGISYTRTGATDAPT